MDLEKLLKREPVFNKRILQNNIEGQENTKFPILSVTIGTSQNKQHLMCLYQYPLVQFFQDNINCFCFSGL